MNKEIKKHQLTTRGAYYAHHLASGAYSNVRTENGIISRPLPYYSTFIRLKQAWDVFRYKADALYWIGDKK